MGRGTGIFSNAQFINAQVPATPVFLSVESRSTTAGFQGGVDMTVRDLAGVGDGLIFGLLTGYTSTSIDVTSTAVSSNTGLIANGAGRLRARLAGPSAGFYTTYFNGGFSTDLTLKVDVFALDESFLDRLGFSAAFTPVPQPPVTVPFAGRASTGLVNGSVIWNVNYRFVLENGVWIEPTTGFRYTSSEYAQNAERLGLDAGHLFRVQGGARLGTDILLAPSMRLTTTLTGLVYSDVSVTGGFVPGAGFLADNILARSDRGKLRGEGILAANLDFGNGVSSFVLADIRGGENLFGVGGRAGVRVQW